jgi:hypothetical protein
MVGFNETIGFSKTALVFAETAPYKHSFSLALRRERIGRCTPLLVNFPLRALCKVDYVPFT